MIPSDSTLSYAPAVHVAGDLLPAAPSKRELKTLDELSLRRREARLKLGVDHLRAALETLREVVGMCDDDLQPSSLDDVLAAVLEKGVALAVVQVGPGGRCREDHCQGDEKSGARAPCGNA